MEKIRPLSGIRSVPTVRWNFVTLVVRREKKVATLVQLATTLSQRELNARMLAVSKKTVPCATKLECLAVTCAARASR